MTVHERIIANKCVDNNASRVKRPIDRAGSVKKTSEIHVYATLLLYFLRLRNIEKVEFFLIRKINYLNLGCITTLSMKVIAFFV